MSTILRVFGQQLWNLAALLILACKVYTIDKWALKPCNCLLYENIRIYDVGEWNVFVQGSIGFWNSVFANLLFKSILFYLFILYR